jgi:hypothetical protein
MDVCETGSLDGISGQDAEKNVWIERKELTKTRKNSMKSFIIYTLHLILLRLSNQG